jgi:Xaa-Pro aminopeptidase
MQARLARLRSRLQKEDLDALLISSLPNVRYLTRFTGSNANCIVTRRQAFFITDSRYTQQSSQEVRGFRRIIAPGGLHDAVSELGLLARCKTVGFEAEAVTYAQFVRLKKLFPRLRLRATKNLVEELSLSKEPGELASIRRAIGITDDVYRDVLDMLKPGIAERVIAAEISYLHKKYGAEHDAFDPIVACGPRGAIPHARPTSRKIRNGELLIMDFGCVVKGYGSDLTRTVCVGRATRHQQKLYAVVLGAQRAAIDAIRPGLQARQLDDIARQYIARAGLAKYFTHALGHGLGLRPHERPRIGPASNDVLQKGNVITIEPGIYIPGYGGIRIEDDVLLTRTGCRVLTKATNELITV